CEAERDRLRVRIHARPLVRRRPEAVDERTVRRSVIGEAEPLLDVGRGRLADGYVSHQIAGVARSLSLRHVPRAAADRGSGQEVQTMAARATYSRPMVLRRGLAGSR